MAGTTSRQGRRPKQPTTEPAPEQPTGKPGNTVTLTFAGDQKELLTVKAVLAAINDGTGDEYTVAVLNEALYRAGAQDPSMELPRSWQRVQRRLGVDRDHLDGVATVDQVMAFADHAGLTVTE